VHDETASSEDRLEGAVVEEVCLAKLDAGELVTQARHLACVVQLPHRAAHLSRHRPVTTSQRPMPNLDHYRPPATEHHTSHVTHHPLPVDQRQPTSQQPQSHVRPSHIRLSNNSHGCTSRHPRCLARSGACWRKSEVYRTDTYGRFTPSGQVIGRRDGRA